MGDLTLAREFVAIAKSYCGADAVKFQKRDIAAWTAHYPALYNAPHPCARNAYGDTYRAHREFLEFDLAQNQRLKEYCDEVGIVYSASVWDLKSAQEIASLNPDFIKIPSACNTNMEMLEWLCTHYPGEIQISTGMTTKHELSSIVELFQRMGRNKDVLIYHCVAGYPVPPEDMCLLDIRSIAETYGSIVKEIGFSGHHLGTSLDVAAYTLGATTVERHFTLDRTWKGTDHAASLEPDAFRKLVRDLNNIHVSLTHRTKEVLDIEEVQRKKLKW
jgi:N-acetylneuraminate synthase